MKEEDVIEILDLLDTVGIEVYIDGGWGVDALLGVQTRTHEDLDIAIPHRDVPKLREILEGKGYFEIPRDDTWECNFVLADGNGREVDVHSFTFEDGKHVFGVEYHPEDLTAIGTIGGRRVKTIDPAAMVRFHTGYKLDENDYRDVKALCDAFSLAMPDEVANWGVISPPSPSTGSC